MNRFEARSLGMTRDGTYDYGIEMFASADGDSLLSELNLWISEHVNPNTNEMDPDIASVTFYVQCPTNNDFGFFGCSAAQMVGPDKDGISWAEVSKSTNIQMTQNQSVLWMRWDDQFWYV